MQLRVSDGPWSFRDFRFLFAADAATQLGFQVFSFALPLIALTALDASAAQVGLLAACVTAPLPLLGLPTGAWLDRRAVRPALLGANLGRCAALATVPAAQWAGVLTVFQLYAVAAVVGTLTVLFDVGHVSLLPSVVGRENLLSANAAVQTMQGVAFAAGPALAGVLVQLVSAPLAVLAALAGHGASAAAMTAVRGERADRTAVDGRHLGREIVEGLRFLLGHPLLRSVMACSATINFFVGLGIPMTVVLLVRDIRLDATTVGLVLACGGAGGVVGGFLLAPFARRVGMGRAITLGALVFGASGLLIPLGDKGIGLVATAVGLFCASLGRIVYNVTVLSLRQAVTPGAMMARVSATGRVLLGGTIPVSNALSGVLAAGIGTRGVLWLSAAGATAAFLWVVRSPVQGVRDGEELT